MKKDIRWFDNKGDQMIVRKFYGEPIAETETTITINYNHKELTLNKERCIICA